MDRKEIDFIDTEVSARTFAAIQEGRTVFMDPTDPRSRAAFEAAREVGFSMEAGQYYDLLGK